MEKSLKRRNYQSSLKKKKIYITLYLLKKIKFVIKKSFHKEKSGDFIGKFY